MKTKLILTLAGLALVFTGFATVLLTTPFDGGNSPVVVKVPKGQPLGRIAQQMEEAKVVRSALAFKLTAKIMGKGEKFKSGHFKIEKPVSILELMAILEEGKEMLIGVTIPEGYRMREIFKVLKAAGFQNQGNYAQLAEDPAFLQSLNLPFGATMLEGLLFPDTYYFPEAADEKMILTMMVENFKQQLPANYAAEAAKVGLTPYQALTLASIVEKETGNKEERRRISAVFHNRMKIGMKLQTDPTVIYGIKDYNGNIKRAHLLMDHPYNTYVHKGLPPTPIASPGLLAILAAVDPEVSKELYFVAKGDGSHRFSATYEEHHSAVREYQLRRVKNYRSY